MVTWTNKHWGALIGAAVLLVITWLGLGAAALVVLGGVIGYFIGKFLDGEIDVEDVRERAQGRRMR
jgi:membrane protein YqaA with SNARE-associated domain